MSNITERKNFKIVILGSFLLSANAGFIGAVSLSGLFSATVAHITGDIIKTSISIAQLDPRTTSQMGFVWLSFIFGSMMSGLMVGATRQFDMSRIYGFAILVESGLLLLSYMLSDDSSPKFGPRGGIWWPEYFAAMACGLQNALTTTYSGAVIRTTHMTGCGTDIGMVVGHEIRIHSVRLYKKFKQSYLPLVGEDQMELAGGPGVRVSHANLSRGTVTGNESTMNLAAKLPANAEPSVIWKLKVLLPILFGYMIGSMIGAASYIKWQKKALVGPILFTSAIGAIYSVLTPGFTNQQ